MNITPTKQSYLDINDVLAEDCGCEYIGDSVTLCEWHTGEKHDLDVDRERDNEDEIEV